VKELQAILDGMDEVEFQEKLGAHFGGPGRSCTKANFPSLYAAALGREQRVCFLLDLPTEVEKSAAAAERSAASAARSARAAKWATILAAASAVVNLAALLLRLH
jgi:hypothetical protein